MPSGSLTRAAPPAAATSCPGIQPTAATPPGATWGWRRPVDGSLRHPALQISISTPPAGLRALSCEGSEIAAQIDRLGDELRFVFITSEAAVHDAAEAPAEAVPVEGFAPGDVSLVVAATSCEKCARCWHHREDVGRDAEHPELCGRCVENVAGPGEARRFA